MEARVMTFVANCTWELLLFQYIFFKEIFFSLMFPRVDGFYQTRESCIFFNHRKTLLCWKNHKAEKCSCGAESFFHVLVKSLKLCSLVSRVLITSDVVSRGIDVQQVSLVINYDLPNSRELYIHR